ncbi:MAG: glycosyltransferase family 4 protein [Sphingorhabdus sp.]|uniref:glycosyltransferase family 4 protein n=1 Tax=Sphingorhabdus sp. TaxID=1902408 RepID=UPI0038FCF0EE
MIDVNYFALLVACASMTLFLCFNAVRLCAYLNLVDVPVGRKQHKTPTPLMGGVVMIAALAPVALVYVFSGVSDRWFGSLLIWIACVTIMAFVGLADDRHTLSPRVRLLISFLVFATAAAVDPTFNVRVLDFNLPKFSMGLGTWWIAILFTTTCCVGLINAVNMADGKNGLVLGLSIGWLLILATRAPETLTPFIFLFAAVLAVLFMFNMAGRLFLGDGGAYAIATAIGLLSIMIYNTPGVESLRAVSAEEIMLLFLVPVFDSFRLTYTRLRQGRSPMSADRDHLHHHIQSIFGWPFGLILYWVVALVPAALLFFAGNTKF